jgi:amphi-Trp domain-containing protein
MGGQVCPNRLAVANSRQRRSRDARTQVRANRDIERDYPRTQRVAKLRRLADCLEEGSRFRIQVGGERVSVPPTARISIEHERGSRGEEIEFQLSWELEN